MIEVTKHIAISGGTPPYEYVWILSGGCASVDIPYGTSDGTVDAVFYFPDVDCITNTVVNLSVTDSTGVCNEIATIQIDNPCTNLVSSVQPGGDVLTFIATAFGGSAPYQYSFSYDTEQYYVKSEHLHLMESGILKLTPLVQGPQEPSTIYLTVTDQNGCVSTSSYNHSPCASNAFPIAVVAVCLYGTNVLSVPRVQLSNYIFPCTPNTPIDWSSFRLYGLPTNLGYTVNSSGQVNFSVSNTVQPGTYELYYEIEDTSGNLSSNTFTIEIPQCGINELVINATDLIYRFNPTQVVVNNVVTLPLQVANADNIDWDKFEFIPEGPQTVSTDKKSLTQPSIAEIRLTDNHEVEYKFLSTLATRVTAKYQLYSKDGIKANTSLLTFDAVTSFLYPLGYDDDVCVSCDAPTPYVNILANDLEVVPGSVVITQQPTYGSVVLTNGNVSYIPDRTVSSATDTMKYIGYDHNGAPTNEMTVTFHRVSAGIPPLRAIDITCKGKAFNLEDYLSGQKDTGTWVDHDGAYTAAGGIISNATLGSVDFSTIPAGQYTFRKDVTISGSPGWLNCPATSSAILSIVLSDVPTVVNDECSGAIQMSCPLTVGSQYVLYNQTLSGQCPISPAPTLSSVALPANWDPATPADIWYTFTYQGSVNPLYVTVIGQTASNLQVAVYNDAGCSCNYGTLSEMVSAVTSGNTVYVAPTGFNVGQCYRIRVSVANPQSAGTFSIYLSGSPII